MKEKIKQFLRSAYYFVANKDYRIVKNSRIFDAGWYRDRIPGLQESSQDPLIHYIDFGIQEGKRPSPLFDPIFYKKNYTTDPSHDLFAHYLREGIRVNHRPCSWFDPEFYQQHYLFPEGDRVSPLRHYLTEGLRRAFYPNFDVYELAVKPVISLIVPVYNVSALHLNNCIRSVLYQSYPHWEICLVDDCSTNKDVRRLLEKWTAQDDRIKIGFLDRNQGISGATNAAVSLATGKYLWFLDNDDELAEECLFTLVQKINSDVADLYYSDENLIGEDGRQFSVFNKPDFNEELLLCHNYVTHFVTEKQLYDTVGGLDSKLDGAQDIDFFLKLSEKAKKIVHIPDILYHWRTSESSTSVNYEQKHYADEAGRKAVVYRIVKNSRLFDASWYCDRIPGLQESSQDPLIHYIDFGIQEGKRPSPLFDPIFYKNTYTPDPSHDPFAHYLREGIRVNHRPCPWFDPEFYQQHYLFPEGDRVSPLRHYLTEGLRRAFYPNSDVYELAVKPVISLIVPVYNVSALHLNNCIRSVLYQSYPHWEICLVDDCSTNKDVRRLLEKWTAQDDRIKIGFLDRNQGISGATNAAASLATGKYLGFLDNDDELAEECLFTLVQKINSDAADLYYSDEDLIGEDGRQFSVFNKPDFNEKLLLCHNYVTHFVVTEKQLYDTVGGLDSKLDGAQDFDLFLKLSEKAKKIVHIPDILYHWRASESSTSVNHEQKQYADEAGRKAVVDALARRQISAEVLLTDWKFFYRIKKERQGAPLVSVIVVSRAEEEFKDWLSDMLSLTHYSNTEFIVVVCSEEELRFFKRVSEDSERTVTFLLNTNNESLAMRYNRAVQESSGQYLVFLNPWIQLQTDEWLEAMLEYAMAKDSGVVGGRILPYQNMDLVATVPDMERQSDLYYARFLQRCSQHMNGLQCVQNVIALSWDLAMVKHDNFLELGGFAEKCLGNLFADSDFCLRLRARGYENVYTPFAFGQWLTPEGNLPFPSQSVTGAEKHFFQEQWQEVLRMGDPYYNHGVLTQKGIDRDKFMKWYTGRPLTKETL